MTLRPCANTAVPAMPVPPGPGFAPWQLGAAEGGGVRPGAARAELQGAGVVEGKDSSGEGEAGQHVSSRGLTGAGRKQQLRAGFILCL